ncbi:zinc finger protein 236-like isoform X2 [Daktulosphaira vitifoliae]|uniref:zinc finger protein 236-like isoform X2 n=1 Tax=Daktulosphaira vitifoliae TaxID=58002 RepID=UPI0021AA671C|nr:zinc finger protein 236-like isoform X2 [Daktulosphaira vitifoliae]
MSIYHFILQALISNNNKMFSNVISLDDLPPMQDVMTKNDCESFPIISQQLDTTLIADIQQTLFIPLTHENQNFLTEKILGENSVLNNKISSDNKLFKGNYEKNINIEYEKEECNLNYSYICDDKKIDNFISCPLAAKKKSNRLIKKKTNKLTNSPHISKKFRCTSCEWTFHKMSLLERHMRTHTGEKPFMCSICSKYFTQKNSLSRHLLKHTGHLPFVCEHCSMNFSQKGHLLNHINRCHSKLKEPTRIHKCNLCACIYNSPNALSKHLNIYHGLKNKKSSNTNNLVLLKNGLSTDFTPKQVSSIKMYSINSDEKDLKEFKELNFKKELSVNSKLDLINKKNLPSLKNAINEVPKLNNRSAKFDDNSEPKVLYVPNISADFNKKNITTIERIKLKVCEFCGKLFKKNADLERHKRIHTGSKPFKCNEQGCVKAFATKCSLEYHTITHLGKMKRAVCPLCNGLFATTSSMRIHLRQHTGEKPFKCPVCGDAFRTSGHLNTHSMIHERKKSLLK